MGVITFNGISSDSFGLQVEHPPIYQIPARDYESVHIPGKNGDLIVDTGSYENAIRTYEVAFGDVGADFTAAASAVMGWLHSSTGYARLEDTYEPDYYRMAIYLDELEAENLMHQAGQCTLEFNCKPQRFLKSGEEAIVLSESGALTNPTYFTALPCITIYGDGEGVLTVGDCIVTISDINSALILDSEIQDAYWESENRNNDIILADNTFPRLESGETAISWSGGITSVEVIPRWWTI